MNKISILYLSLIGLVAGQSGLPSCAQSCVTQFTSGTSIGGCNGIDIKCICSQQDFLSGIACCLASACNEADQQSSVDYARQLCATAGVTVPDAVTCSSTSAGASTGTASSTESSTSGSANTTASTTGTASTKAASSASSTATAASANAGHQGVGGFETSGVLGGILAALALL